MKTTIDISDNLLNRAKQLARQKKTALKELTEEGLSPAFRGKSWVEFRDEIYRGCGSCSPSTREAALASLAAWLGSPACVTFGRVVGGLIHDARVAAICLHHGETTLWTVDRDFSRFPQLKTKNPLVKESAAPSSPAAI